MKTFFTTVNIISGLRKHFFLSLFIDERIRAGEREGEREGGKEGGRERKREGRAQGRRDEEITR